MNLSEEAEGYGEQLLLDTKNVAKAVAGVVRRAVDNPHLSRPPDVTSRAALVVLLSWVHHELGGVGTPEADVITDLINP